MNLGPYHIFPIGIILIITYLCSLLGVRLQLVDPGRHRRFWNLLLLLFFLSASLLGIFLAIKVNYKLNIRWIDRAMQWHVDIGIALAFVAVFHLTWHLGYFKKALTGWKIPGRIDKLTPHLEYTPFQVRILFLLLGFMTMITQLVLLREYLKALHGNELVIGLFLAIWMVSTAAGARAGTRYLAKVSVRTVLLIFLLLAIFPVLVCTSLIGINRLLLLPGFIPGILSSISHMMLIIPFTLVTGFMFSYLARAIKYPRVDESLYMLDSLGSLAGGLLFGLLLVFFFDNMQVLFMLLVFTSFILLVLFRSGSGRAGTIAIMLAGIAGFGLLISPGTRNWLEGLRYAGETILDTRDTAHGNVAFTERDGLVTGYLDRNPVVSSFEPAYCEELVHYPSLQHPDPSSFLVIGGGISGIGEEVVKYDPQIFDYCETNRVMYRLAQKYLPSPAREHFIHMDGRRWLASGDSTMYDVIISAAGEPLTLGRNRYYTEEFFRLVKSRLAPGGVFSVHLPAAGNYINDPGSEQLKITHHTLREVFSQVLLVPGRATFFLASENAMSLDFPALVMNKGINTTYVHPDYLDAVRLDFESGMLVERIFQGEDSRINTDLWPVLFYRSLSGWSIMMGGKKLLPVGIAGLLLFVILLISYTRESTAMFVAGFSGAGMQILLILVMQAFYGIVYLVTPLMVTLFMGGIVLGTHTWRSVWQAPSVSKTTALLWILALIGAVAVVVLNTGQQSIEGLTGMVVLGLLNFLPGIVVGSVYGMLTGQFGNEPALLGRLYNADLAGAALGTLVPPLFLVPLIGVSNTFILFCGINVATGLLLQTGKRYRAKGGSSG